MCVYMFGSSYYFYDTLIYHTWLQAQVRLTFARFFAAPPRSGLMTELSQTSFSMVALRDEVEASLRTDPDLMCFLDEHPAIVISRWSPLMILT